MAKQHKLTKSDPLYGQVQRADIYERNVGLDVALYDPAGPLVHILNMTAAAIWRHISGDRSSAAIVAALGLALSPTAEPIPRLAGDVEWMILRFKELGLLTTKDAVAPERDQKPVSLTIPDNEISTIGPGYVPPSIKSYTLDELSRLFELGKPLVHSMRTFGDTFIVEPQ